MQPIFGLSGLHATAAQFLNGFPPPPPGPHGPIYKITPDSVEVQNTNDSPKKKGLFAKGLNGIFVAADTALGYHFSKAALHHGKEVLNSGIVGKALHGTLAALDAWLAAKFIKGAANRSGVHPIELVKHHLLNAYA